MATDPRELRPSELCRLLNSTPLGEVINAGQLHRHRTRAGLCIGDAHHVDLLRYMAWLVKIRHAPKPEHDSDPYEKLKDRARARNAAIASAGREIGELPAVVHPKRKQKASSDFRFFCESYFAATFYLPWSQDHLKVIDKIQKAVLRGGLFAMAMPRGSGKSSLCEAACLWAMLFGHRRFVVLIGSDEGNARQMLDALKAELETNPKLEEDFPEVCFPIGRLEGISNRCRGQLYQGQRTRILWTDRMVILPTVEGSKASAAIVRVAGITGGIRGMKYKRPDSEAARPDLVIIDDPQTDESARSPSQSFNREAILAGAILGLAGPGKKIAGIMPCTVIHAGDMADRILDRRRHPQWQGERTKMLLAPPSNEELWTEYASVRATNLADGMGLGPATKFYRDHRQAMDHGAQISWPERFNDDELSAIQHAMNLKLQDEVAFFAEYQNEPLLDVAEDQVVLSADEIAQKLNGRRQGEIPTETHRLTAFIDVQKTVLYFCVVAWSDSFDGFVVDYGTWPDQRRTYFSLADVKRTILLETDLKSFEAGLYRGLEILTNQLLEQSWTRDDGAMISIDRLLIDANWGESTDTIYLFSRQAKHAAQIMPSHGRYVGATSTPMNQYRRRRGDRVGNNWRVPSVTGTRTVRHVVFDTNHWKSFIVSRWKTPMGEPGCLSLWGDQPARHRMFADHQTSEKPVRVEAKGRQVDEWKLPPNKPDNHWLDCLVGCAVAASMQGISLLGETVASRRHAKRISLAELQQKKRGL